MGVESRSKTMRFAGGTQRVTGWAVLMFSVLEAATAAGQTFREDSGGQPRLSRQRADELERQAQDEAQQRGFKQCGRLLRAASDADPNSPRDAHRLVNATRCFRRAHILGAALQARQELFRRHPYDPLTKIEFEKIWFES